MSFLSRSLVLVNTPRSEAGIPESVSRMLTPRFAWSRTRPTARAACDRDRRWRAREEAHQSEGAHGALPCGRPARFGKPLTCFGGCRRRAKTIVVSPQDHVNDFPDDLACRSLEESNGEAPAAKPATRESLPAVAARFAVTSVQVPRSRPRHRRSGAEL
jgi:hypothetical protein